MKRGSKYSDSFMKGRYVEEIENQIKRKKINQIGLPYNVGYFDMEMKDICDWVNKETDMFTTHSCSGHKSEDYKDQLVSSDNGYLAIYIPDKYLDAIHEKVEQFLSVYSPGTILYMTIDLHEHGKLLNFGFEGLQKSSICLEESTRGIQYFLASVIQNSNDIAFQLERISTRIMEQRYRYLEL